MEVIVACHIASHNTGHRDTTVGWIGHVPLFVDQRHNHSTYLHTQAKRGQGKHNELGIREGVQPALPDGK